MRRDLFGVLVLTTAFSTFGAAHAAQESKPTWPPPRAGHGMVYDAVLGRIVMFGGWTTGNGRLNDTWVWDGARWEEIEQEDPKPPARAEMQMSYDAERRLVYLFGGWGEPATPLDDMWSFNGVRWTQIAQPEAGEFDLEALGLEEGEKPEWPGVRWYGSMTYDEARKVNVLWGGRGLSRRPRVSTWEWDGASWTRIDIAGPPPRTMHSNAYIPDRGTVFIFGGEGPRSGGALRGQTFEYDGEQWTAHTRSRTERLYNPAITYDRDRGKVVSFGGASQIRVSDTYEWDGETWERISTSNRPRGRSEAKLVFFPGAGAVLFGGFAGPNNFPDRRALDDMWAWDGDRWSRITPAAAN